MNQTLNEFKSFYKTVKGGEGNRCYFNTRLDLYGCGCAHNCSYCFARSLLSFRGLWRPDNPSAADMKKVLRTINNKIDAGSVIRLGGMTDCFQPVESIVQNTYNTILALNKKRIHYLIVTKSCLVADYRYIDILDRQLAHIQISITTTDDNFSSSYENAPLPSDRIKAVEKLHALGFDVQIRLSPFIPSFIDYDILNNIKCSKILIEFLRVNSFIKRWFNLDYSEYSLKAGNYYHLPLHKKLDYISRIYNFDQMSVCDDVPDHYDYFKHHFNFNPDNCCNLSLP